MPTLVHTADGKYVLAAAGVHVKLFSCETGALVRLLSGHSAAVTAVDRADDNVLQVWSPAENIVVEEEGGDEEGGDVADDDLE